MNKNLETVKKYFKYCVDGKDVERVNEFFSPNLVIHRPDLKDPIINLEDFKKALKEKVTDRYDSIETTFQKEVYNENEVVVALTHVAKGSNTWMGKDVNGKDLSWTSLTYFRFDNEGLIVEEIVERNELWMAKQLGLVNF